MLQTKVKNLHQREILNLEKEFHSNLDKMKLRVEEELKDQFKKDFERQETEIVDRQEQI